ncbi:MAG: hypothetical protein FWF46_04275 [Oscillospiraceae bacterium]|nr:hypothetical protein [Oscillospiraceae bacterium]
MKNSTITKIITIIGLALLFTSIIMIIWINAPITSRSRVISLLQKTTTSNNLYAKMTTLSDNSNNVTESEFFKKDNLQLMKINSPIVNETICTNTSNNEIIRIDNSSLIAVKTNPANMEKTVNYEYVPSYIMDTNTSFKYITQENFNNVKCVVAEFAYTDSSTGSAITHKLWIDRNDGTVQKDERTEINPANQTIKSVTTYETEFGVVNQSEVATPDLSNYTLARY